jgi:hypothetical protein
VDAPTTHYEAVATMTAKSMTDDNTRRHALVKLQQMITSLEADERNTLDCIVNLLLQQNNEIDWDTIKSMERVDLNNSDNCIKLDKHWRYKLIRSMTAPGRFKKGGDRKSIKAPGAAQQVIVAHVEKQAIEAPDQMQTDEVECGPLQRAV